MICWALIGTFLGDLLWHHDGDFRCEISNHANRVDDRLRIVLAGVVPHADAIAVKLYSGGTADRHFAAKKSVDSDRPSSSDASCPWRRRWLAATGRWDVD